MGFMDKEVKNSFDSMFDLNKDGWLDAVEPRMDRALMDKLVY